MSLNLVGDAKIRPLSQCCDWNCAVMLSCISQMKLSDKRYDVEVYGKKRWSIKKESEERPLWK